MYRNYVNAHRKIIFKLKNIYIYFFKCCKFQVIIVQDKGLKQYYIYVTKII